MNKNIIISIIITALGLLIAFGPQSLFKVCSPKAMQTESDCINHNGGYGAGSALSDCCSSKQNSHKNNNAVITGACGGPCGIGCGCGNSGNCAGEGCGTLGGICGEGKTAASDNCGSENGSCGCGKKSITYPTCHWTAQAVLAFGFLIAALGLCMIVFMDIKIHLGLIIAIFFSGIAVLFIPHGLIGGCEMMTMACRKIAFPAITIIDAILLALSAAYTVFIVVKKTPAENS